MSVNNFIPQVWAARVQTNLQKALVFAQAGVINRDWEGEIREQGDTVHLNSIGEPTVFDYTKNTDMPAPETLQDSRITLTITQAKGFNFQVDDVDRAQTRPDVMDPAMARAAYKLSDITDQYIASQMVAGAAAPNNVGTNADPIVAPVAEPTASPVNVYNLLVDLSVNLNEADVPREGRFAVIPPWFEGLIRKDPRFTAERDQVLLNGQIGRAAGFNLLVSNNTPTNAAPGGAANVQTRYRIVAGHSMATTFADQINKVEAYRPERRFGDAVKGLHLYGSLVTEPDALAVLTATQT